MLLGRTESKLREVESSIISIGKGTKVSVYVADVTDDAAIKKVAEAVGTWNAVVHCAGYMNKPAPAVVAELGDYWSAFEV